MLRSRLLGGLLVATGSVYAAACGSDSDDSSNSGGAAGASGSSGAASGGSAQGGNQNGGTSGMGENGATGGAIGGAGASGGVPATGGAGAEGGFGGSAGMDEDGGTGGGGAAAAGQAGGPFSCGNTTCEATQYCVIPCCGTGGPLRCFTKPDGGTCPPDTTDEGTCCREMPCTPPPPRCSDRTGPVCITVSYRTCTERCG